MKTGVLVHGCNLLIENWRHVAWGDPPDQLGRIPQGVLVAMEHDASTIVFGTGASSKTFRLGDSDKQDQELLEADYSLEYLRSHFASLTKFRPIAQRFPNLTTENGVDEARENLLGRIVIDTDSQNTVEEIRNAGEIFLEHDIDRVILVSSPSHVVRCLRDAISIFHSEPKFARFANEIYACPSMTCYEGTSAGDVVVVEPPHRPDRHVVPTHRRIQRMLTLQKLNYDDLVSLIEEFDDLLQRYENRYFNGPE